MAFRPRYPKSPPAGPSPPAQRNAAGETATLLAQFHGFSHGRTALRLGLVHLGFRAGDRVLVPDFVCDALVLPLEQLGLLPVYYPVDRFLRPEWDALGRIARDGARALVMVHYFGRPQQTDAYRAFCSERRLVLIEDNAHGFGGSEGGRMLGTIGDIGISSPWKNFAIRNGALLHLSGPGDPRWRDLPDEPRRFLPTRRSLLSRFEAGWRHENRRFGHGLQEIAPTPPMQDRRMAADALAALAGEDLAACAARRRDIYRVWDDWARRSGLQPVFDHPPLAESPLLYPAFCRSADRRRALLEWCWRHRIEAYTWPKLPQAVLQGSGGAPGLWQRMICLPIHQAMVPAGLASDLEIAGPPP